MIPASSRSKLLSGARGGEEGAHLRLPDAHRDAASFRSALQELLDDVVARADREQLDAQAAPAAHAHSIGAAPPARGVQQRVGAQRVDRGGAPPDDRVSGGTGADAGVPNPASATSTIRARSMDRATASRTRASSNGGRVVLKNSPPLNEHRIRQHLERASRSRQRHHGRRDPRHVELTAREAGEFRGRLVHDRDHEPAQRGRPAEGAGKIVVSHEAPVRAARRLANGTGRCRPALVERRARHRRARRRREKVRRHERQLGEVRRAAGLRRAKRARVSCRRRATAVSRSRARRRAGIPWPDRARRAT